MRKVHTCSSFRETTSAEAEDMKKSLSRITDANKNVKEKFVGKLKYAA
jgi:hypothetical protein